MNHFMIANPTFDLTFKDLFGSNGSLVNDLGPKDRLISFLNSIYPDDHITYIEYINTINEQISRKKNIFDVACKCFDSKQKNVYDIEIQTQKYKAFYDRSIVYTNQLFCNNTIEGASYSNQPHARVLSILNFVIDEEQPAIFNAHMSIDNTGEKISDLISLTYIQLPILLETGTDNQWLKILSSGANNSEFNDVEIDGANLDDAIKSGLTLLRSYTQDGKKEKIIMAKQAYFNDLALEASEKEANLENTFLILNQNNTKIILNAYRKGHNADQIADFMLIPVELVSLVIDIADLAECYLNYCSKNLKDPDYETFSKEAQNRFQNVTPEIIDLITGS